MESQILFLSMSILIIRIQLKSMKSASPPSETLQRCIMEVRVGGVLAGVEDVEDDACVTVGMALSTTLLRSIRVKLS